MTVERVKEYPYPENLDSVEKIQDYLKELYKVNSEGSAERISDFDILKLSNVPWVDVRQYGAKGDGVTDDTAAIQAAINSLTGGGVVLLAPKTYKISSTLTIAKDGVSIFGSGMKATTLSFSSALGANPAILISATSPTRCYFNNIRDLGIYLTHDSSDGIKLVRGHEQEISRCFITGLDTLTQARTAVIMDGTGAYATGLRLRDNDIRYQKFCIKLTNLTTYCHIMSNWFMGNSTVATGSMAVYIDGVSGAGSFVDGNEIEGFDYGIYLDDTESVCCVNNRFEGITTAAHYVGASSRHFYIAGSQYAGEIPNSINSIVGYWETRSYDGSVNFGRGNSKPSVIRQYGVGGVSGGANQSPHHDFYISGESASVLGKVGVNGTGEVNDFGETTTAREAYLIGVISRLKIGTTDANPTIFYNNSAEKARIDSTGFNVGGVLPSLVGHSHSDFPNLVIDGITQTYIPYRRLTASVLTDGGLELWDSSTVLTNWSKYEEGTSTVNREGTDKHGGTYSCRLDVDSSNSGVNIYQSVTLSATGAYELSLWYKTAVGKLASFYLRDSADNVRLASSGSWGTPATDEYISLPAATSWTKYEINFLCHPSYTDYVLVLGRQSAASSSIYFDDISFVEAGSFSDSPLSTDGTIINIASLVSYANDAAAAAGGLIAGDLYTETGTDPLRLAVKS